MQPGKQQLDQRTSACATVVGVMLFYRHKLGMHVSVHITNLRTHTRTSHFSKQLRRKDTWEMQAGMVVQLACCTQDKYRGTNHCLWAHPQKSNAISPSAVLKPCPSCFASMPILDGGCGRLGTKLQMYRNPMTFEQPKSGTPPCALRLGSKLSQSHYVVSQALAKHGFFAARNIKMPLPAVRISPALAPTRPWRLCLWSQKKMLLDNRLRLVLQNL